MERNIDDINREPYAIGFRHDPSFRGAPFRDFAEPFRQRLTAAVFFGDLTKKLVSSAGEKAASAIGAKAGEALGNKLFNRQKKKPKSHEGPPKAAPAGEENKGSELVKLLQVENKLRSAAPRVSQSNIHEIYNRLLIDE